MSDATNLVRHTVTYVLSGALQAIGAWLFHENVLAAGAHCGWHLLLCLCRRECCLSHGV
jgi:hypothetical protein